MSYHTYYHAYCYNRYYDNPRRNIIMFISKVDITGREQKHRRNRKSKCDKLPFHSTSSKLFFGYSIYWSQKPKIRFRLNMNFIRNISFS